MKMPFVTCCQNVKKKPTCQNAKTPKCQIPWNAKFLGNNGIFKIVSPPEWVGEPNLQGLWAPTSRSPPEPLRRSCSPTPGCSSRENPKNDQIPWIWGIFDFGIFKKKSKFSVLIFLGNFQNCDFF